MSTVSYEIYQDAGGVATGLKTKGWRWRAVSSNGRITAASGENFSSKRNAIRAVKNFVQSHSPDRIIPVRVIDVTKAESIKGRMKPLILECFSI